MNTRITELLGIRYPVFRAAMSWASSNAPLAVAVSNAGAMGVIAAAPMRPDAFRKTLADIKAGTDKPYGVNIPLANPRAIDRGVELDPKGALETELAAIEEQLAAGHWMGKA
ncbi:MAG: nitronate monooxygenase [Burkholderiales bacterium]